MKVKFGPFDAVSPNGLVIVGDQQAIFGLRLLTLDTSTGELVYQRQVEAEVCPAHDDGHFEVKWEVNGKKAKFTWTRLKSNQVYARTEFDAGLNIIAELYVPWRDRLQREWVNYSRQSDRVFTGELISPFTQCKNNAIRVLTERKADSWGGYNMRREEYEKISAQRKIVNVSPKRIWSDLGLWWHFGLKFDRDFSLLIECGNAGAFLDTPEDSRIDRMMETAKLQAEREARRQEKNAFAGTGIYRDICQVLPAALYYNTLYHYPSGKRYIITDRTWTRNDEDWGILFNWDTFISSWLAAWFDPALAQENMLCAYEMQLPDGKIPLHSRAADGYCSEPPITAGRCQHIVQGLTMWNTYLHSKDKVWLRKCYQKAKRVHSWWFMPRKDGQRTRDPKNMGLLTFGYDPEQEMGILGAKAQPYAGKAQYAYFETYDDNPQWTNGSFFRSTEDLEQSESGDFTDEAKYDEQTHTANLYTLERSCLYALECLQLKNAALELGLEDDAALFQNQYDQIKEKINRYMWDEETGCYYNVKFDGTLSRVQTPDCFLPVAAGVADGEKTERLLSILTDEKKFWGDYPMPSVAKDHPAYPTQTYWRGAIWPPMVMWTYLALKNTNRSQLRWEYARKVSDMLRNEWVKHNRYPENYNSITGACNGSPHYNWGVLMGLPLIEELVDVRSGEVIFGNEYAPVGSGISGIKLDGCSYEVRVTQQGTQVFRDGEQIASGAGRVTIKR